MEKNQAHETSQGGQRSAIWAMLQTKGTFKNKLSGASWSDGRGQSNTRKMEEEALQKNEADEIGRVGVLRSLPPSYAAGVP